MRNINFAELYDVLPNEKDFSGAIRRSLKNGVKHLSADFCKAIEDVRKEKNKINF